MKRFFKFALVALATAAVAVACQKPEQQPEKIALKGISLNKPAVELAIGAKETLTVKFDPENVTEKPTIEWSSSAPAVATVAEGEVTAVAAGEATITAKAGSFTATCKVTVKGEEQPEPGDFTSPDWANIGAITNGNHTFKFTKDDKFAYFYTERPKDDRFGELWGDGVGYVYYAFDFDGDLTTGEELLGNGKYEYIAYIYCFGGSANAPEIKITAEGGVAPSSYSIANVIAKGTVDANGLKLEYAVPLSDLPQLPENFTIYTWGNKSLSKVEYKYPYEAPAPVVEPWDYTPSAEYLAATNLWKAVEDADAVSFFYHYPAAGYTTVNSDTYELLSKNQSTYVLDCPVAAADGLWSNQIFMYPKEGHFIALDPTQTYKFKVTLGSNKDFPGFFKMTTYNPDNVNNHVEGAALWETNYEDGFFFEGGKPVVVETELTGKEANNLVLIFAFGKNPEECEVYIKDIILEQEGAPVPDTWDYTPSPEYLASTNLWKAVDADEPTITFLYHPNWADPTEEPTAELKESTYTIKLKDADAGNAYSGQMIITPKNDFIIDPAKTYNFSCKIHSTTGTSVWIKMHQPGVNWPEVFETNGAEAPADRIAIAAGETKEIKVEGIKSMYESALPQELLFDFAPHGADNIIHIKDIIVEEVGGDVPPAGLNVDVLDMEFTAVDKTSNSYFDWSDRAGTASTAIYAGQSSTGTGQYIQLRTKNNNSGIITTASGGKLRQVTVAFNSATTDRKINVYAKNTAYTSPTDLYDDTKAGTLLGSIQAGSGNYTIDVTDDYAFVGLRSADGAIYVDKIEIAWEPSGDVPPAPTGIKIDGDFSDWAGIDGATTENNRITLWKASSDANNIYFYYEITASKVKTKGDNFDWSPYIYIGLDTDNDSSTGAAAGGGTTIAGCEVQVCTFPWRGTNTLGNGNEEVFDTSKHSFVNGEDQNGWVKFPVSGSSVAFPVVYGKIDGSICYLELSIPRSAIGSPTGTINVESAMDWYPSGPGTITLK